MTICDEKKCLKLKESNNWIKGNLFALIALIGSILWGVAQLSTVAGQIKQSLTDIDKRVERLENRAYPDNR